MIYLQFSARFKLRKLLLLACFILQLPKEKLHCEPKKGRLILLP
jgi:hypothetical protein